MRPIHQVVPRLLIHAGSARRLSSGRVLHCRPDRDRRDVGRWSEAHVDDHAEDFDEGLRDDHDGDGQRVGARFARRSNGRQRQGDLAPCHFQRIAHQGACGKTRVGPQNRRPDQERTKGWGHDVRVLLSTDRGRGEEPLVGPALRLRALGAEACVCAPPKWSGEGSER
jgi:hypothetical protein